MRLGWAWVAALVLIAGCAAPPARHEVTVPPPAPPAAPPAEATVAAESLLEVQTPALLARFGQPSEQRRDGGAQVWVYDRPALCRLNLVLQRERQAWKVVHALARVAPGVDAASCLAGLERR